MSAEMDACCGYAERTDWPAEVSRLLFEQIARLGVGDRTVLEIGCGYGRLLVGTLLGGARAASGIELDPDAVEEAVERASRAGVADRCVLLVGDGAAIRLGSHDIVVLDRVICCYRDADRLVDRTLAAADHAYALSVPESRGLLGVRNRLRYGIEGKWDRLRGNERTYLHDVRRIERRLVAAGFRRHAAEQLGKWYLGVYVRGPLATAVRH
ncbi:MAG: methyltransferase domain-containing protein [Candidatus Limnocylindria bacterium]